MQRILLLSLITLVWGFTSSVHKTNESHQPIQTMTPDTAMKWLANGNLRYVKGNVRRDGQSGIDRKKLESAQHPHTIVLSCSDSRVPPELIFDQKLGEIFVIRTAGETLDSIALASIEYAVEHLGVRLLLVLAHESCGAVKAAITALDGQSLGSVHLDKLVADIKPRIMATLKGNKHASKNAINEAWANASGIAEDLRQRSKIIAEAFEKNHLAIKTAMYHLSTGKVEFD